MVSTSLEKVDLSRGHLIRRHEATTAPFQVTRPQHILCFEDTHTYTPPPQKKPWETPTPRKNMSPESKKQKCCFLSLKHLKIWERRSHLVYHSSLKFKSWKHIKCPGVNTGAWFLWIEDKGGWPKTLKKNTSVHSTAPHCPSASIETPISVNLATADS